ncbi:hypothetical protein NL676_038504 [Syzygium grande]|nr:hypothetical protein NL676_038504 [Syzygium grande]
MALKFGVLLGLGYFRVGPLTLWADPSPSLSVSLPFSLPLWRYAAAPTPRHPAPPVPGKPLRLSTAATRAAISVGDRLSDTTISVDDVMLLSDGNGDFTRAIGCELDLSDQPVGLEVRSRRYALLAKDGVVKVLNLHFPQGPLLLWFAVSFWRQISPPPCSFWRGFYGPCLPVRNWNWNWSWGFVHFVLVVLEAREFELCVGEMIERKRINMPWMFRNSIRMVAFFFIL